MQQARMKGRKEGRKKEIETNENKVERDNKSEEVRNSKQRSFAMTEMQNAFIVF